MKFERSKKTDHGVFLKRKYQGIGVLNYKRMFRHLLEIHALYLTIETFICFSAYSTWAVLAGYFYFVWRSFIFFILKKFKLKLKTRIFEWWSGISFFHIWFVIIWTIVSGDKSQEKWKMICLSPAHSFIGGHWVRLLNLAPVTWLGSCCNMT